jgi:hypothetical protein
MNSSEHMTADNIIRIFKALAKETQIELSLYQKLAIVKDVIDDREKSQLICQEIIKQTIQPENIIGYND